MNIKKTALGLGAATALSLSMISGAVAQELTPNNHHDRDEQRESVTATVNLVEGACAFTLGAHNLDFGDLTWDGTQWATPDAQELTLAVTDGHNGDGCRVTASSLGLFNRGDRNNDVAAANFDNNGDRDGRGDRGDRIGVTIDGNELRYRPTTVYDGGATDDTSLAVGLNTSNPDLDAGHYSGNIYFQLGRGR